MTRPPPTAMWLLTRMAPGVSDYLLGDLLEEFRLRGSTAWYWRQALSVIVVHAGRQIYRHPLHAIRAALVGWAFLWIFFAFLFQPIVGLDEWLFVRGLVDSMGWWPDAKLLTLVVAPIGFAGSGWVVARSHGRETMLAFLATVLFWNLTILWRIVFVEPHRLEDFAILTTIHHFGVMPVSIMLGGLIANVNSSRAQLS